MVTRNSNWSFRDFKERYEDDPSTYSELNLDLGLEAGSSDGPDRNQVYDISNNTVEDIRIGYNVSTVDSSQSGSSSKYLVI